MKPPSRYRANWARVLLSRARGALTLGLRFASLMLRGRRLALERFSQGQVRTVIPLGGPEVRGVVLDRVNNGGDLLFWDEHTNRFWRGSRPPGLSQPGGSTGYFLKRYTRSSLLFLSDSMGMPRFRDTVERNPRTL